jgi:hypothetical protein
MKDRGPGTVAVNAGVFRWWVTRGTTSVEMSKANDDFKAFQRGEIDHLPTIPGAREVLTKGVSTWR